MPSSSRSNKSSSAAAAKEVTTLRDLLSDVEKEAIRRICPKSQGSALDRSLRITKVSEETFFKILLLQMFDLYLAF